MRVLDKVELQQVSGAFNLNWISNVCTYVFLIATGKVPVATHLPGEWIPPGEKTLTGR